MKRWLKKVLKEIQPFLDGTEEERYLYVVVPAAVLLKIKDFLPKKVLSGRFVLDGPLGNSIPPSVSDFLEVAHDVLSFRIYIESLSKFAVRGVIMEEEKAIPILRKLLQPPTTPPYGVSYDNHTIDVWW